MINLRESIVIFIVVLIGEDYTYLQDIIFLKFGFDFVYKLVLCSVLLGRCFPYV